ncbi:MAG TPA: hypothetical protein VKY85_06675 [Candidatus Angelobacter sp.]|nr:hypothetical protein [Candidatus Angelobacter sp.]
MRWRTSFHWALSALVAWVALLAFDGRPNHTFGAGGGMSAPSGPGAFVKSAPVAKGLQSHCDGCGHALRSAHVSLVLRAILAGEASRQVVGVVQPHYGPLYRRPPPSLS